MLKQNLYFFLFSTGDDEEYLGRKNTAIYIAQLIN